MTYLNPALWAGLLLAALPILIHLLGRKRLRRQPFPTLEFLRKLQLKRMRKLRIRQWLLLLLRTLAVLALAYAFLRPAVKKTSGGGRARSDTVVLLDLSASMSARRLEGQPLARLKQMLKEIFQSIDPLGRIAIVVADGRGDRDVPWQSPEGNVPTWIDQFNSDGRSADLPTAWYRVTRLLSQSAAPHKEVLWLSDFCDPEPDSLPALPQQVDVIRIPTTPEGSAPNVAITDVRFTDATLQPNVPMGMEILLQFIGGDAPVSAILSVTIDGRRVAENEVTLSPEKVNTSIVTLQPQKPGKFAAEAQIEFDDALALDNRFPFVFTIPQRRNILITGDDLRAMRFFELALNPDSDNSGYFNVTIRPGGIEGLNLEDYNVLILSGRSAYRPSEARRIDEYVKNGGGIWLLLGSKADLASYGRELLPQFNLGPILDETSLPIYHSRWEDLDYSHPVFSSLIKRSGRYDAPLVKRVFKIKEEKGDRVLIRLTDGTPFLVERKEGHGRLWWTPSSADTSWTDWALSGIFAPMVQAGVGYLATGDAPIFQMTPCGEPVYWQMGSAEKVELREALDPLGNLIPVTADFHSGSRQWRSDATNWPGHYRLLEKDREINLTAVQFPAKESNLTVENLNSSKLPGVMLRPNPEESLSDALVRLHHGKEISLAMVVLALTFLVTETLIASERRPVL